MAPPLRLRRRRGRGLQRGGVVRLLADADQVGDVATHLLEESGRFCVFQSVLTMKFIYKKNNHRNWLLQESLTIKIG